MTSISQTNISSKKISLVFLGTGPVAAAGLAFLSNHFSIEAVITKPRAPGHKGSVPVEEFCHQRHITPLFVRNKYELDNLISETKFSSTLGVVVDFGIIISQKVIDSFPNGIINSHFSLLPEWRGADPISFAVLSGQSKTGVSLMVINDMLDTGKLITQHTLTIAPKETTGSLTKKLVTLSNQLLVDYLPLYLDGKILPKNQPHPDRATYSHKLSKADAMIDWHENASVIERKIRAYQPWPKARTRLGTIDCIIIDAQVISSRGEKSPGDISVSSPRDDMPYLVVTCGKDSLSLLTLQPLGKKEMPVRAFLSGYRSHIRIN